MAFSGAKCGRVEARWVLSSNQSFTWTDSAGSAAAVVTAGSYTPTELCAALEAAIIALSGSIGNTATVTISNGEAGSGRITVNSSQTPFSLTFPGSISFAMGFQSNISSASSAQTGSSAARGIWLPDVVKWSPYGDLPGNTQGGHLVSDLRTSVSPSGVVHAIVGNHFRLYEARWQGVSRARAVVDAYNTVQGQSFQEFFQTVVLGEYSSYIPINPVIIWYWDADQPSEGNVTGRFLWRNDLRLEMFVSGWAGKYNIELPTLVAEPNF